MFKPYTYIYEKSTSANKSHLMVIVLAYLHDPLQHTQTVNGQILHTKISTVDWSRSEIKRDRLGWEMRKQQRCMKRD